MNQGWMEKRVYRRESTSTFDRKSSKRKNSGSAFSFIGVYIDDKKE